MNKVVNYVNTGWAQKEFAPFPDQLAGEKRILNRWLGSMRITPVSADEWHLDPHFHQGPRYTPDVNWMSFIEGGGYVIIGENEQKIKVRPGSIVIYHPGMRHIEFYPSSKPTVTTSIHFTAFLWGRLDMMSLLGFPVHIPARPDGYLARLSTLLVREFHMAEPGWKRRMEALITDGLFHVVRNHGRLFKGRGTAYPDNDLPRLIPAFDLMEQEISSPELSIGDVAESVHLSEGRFRRIFKKVTGRSPVKFLQQTRIDHSCFLLRTTDSTIQQIADESGFKDLGFFYRVFRKWVGMTPAEYRNRISRR